MNQIREQVSGSLIQQEALSLIEQIYELELKHDQLLNENKPLLPSEHQKLTTQIEDDNQELASIEKQIIELQKHNENLKQFSNDNIEHNYDEFLTSYEQTHEQYLNDIKNLQKRNLTLLSFFSRILVQGNYTQLKTNFDQYEIEKQNSNNTLAMLAEQHRKLKQDFLKLETLDQRLTDELQELKIKYTKMKEDLAKLNDLDSLKRKAERRKQQLIADKMNMIKQRQITQTEIQTLQSQFETIRTQLQDNEIHQQVINLLN
jgi:intraflagellar transport protein 74